MSIKKSAYKGFLALLIIILPWLSVFSQTDPVCSLITDNYSGQITSGRCAPVALTMEVVYKFMTAVDPSKVKILYRWNDGTGAEDIVDPVSIGDTVFRAVMAHVYPPAGDCSYTAEAFVICDGTICLSSSRQEQQFSSWARDNENGGVIITEPVEAMFCEGEDVYVKFKDNSNFNCNISVEPDKPNRLTRWVQFIYGTNTNSGNRIPNITVTDAGGIVHYMTDATGNPLGTFSGPIIPVPINADAPNQTAFPIAAPAGGLAGDIFEITLRNWNVCNAYDNKPFDGIPPVNLIDGDNPPITTTALVRIITTPPVINNPKENYCVNSSIEITVPQAGDQIRWYSDSLRMYLVHTGASFDPTEPPVNLDNSVAGLHRFWVTDAIGQCESAPSKIDMEIFAMPNPVPNAGPDQTICDNQTLLDGTVQTIGTGVWTTTSPATIVSDNNPKTQVTNLSFGTNLFTWKVTNGPCKASDNVLITSDRQPAPADAGRDSSFCNINAMNLKAASPTQNGKGTWSVFSGGASITDNSNPISHISGMTLGINKLVWSVVSQYGACIPSTDTVNYLVDLSPDPANVGPDQQICDTSGITLPGNAGTNGATGTWTVTYGLGNVSDINNANALATGLSEGKNSFLWTLNSAYGICPFSEDTINIIRDLAPNPANAGPDQALCSVTSSNAFVANIPNRGIAKWIVVQNPSGNNPTFLPTINSPTSILSINPGDEGRYDLAWQITNGSCQTIDTLTVDFGVPPSPADAGPDKDTCGLEIVLNAKAPLYGYGTWTKVSGSGIVSFLSGIHDPKTRVRINAGDEGVYKLEWIIASGLCIVGSSNHDTVVIVFRPKPLPPVMRDTSSCGEASLTINSLLNLNATSNRWYDALAAGNLLHEGLSFTTPLLTVDRLYYISGYNSTSLCESERVKIRVDINPVPGIPAAANLAHCGENVFALSSLIGSGATENQWFSDSIAGSAIYTGLNYTTPLLSASKSFYVMGVNTVTGCHSKRKEVKAIVHIIPSLPASNDVSHCGPGTLTLLATKGTNASTVRWYDSKLYGTLIETSDILYTPSLDTTRSYWIASYNDTTNCESERIEVKAVIKPIPDPPIVSDVSSCGPDTLRFTSTIGTNGTSNIWYDNIIGSTILSINQNYSPFVNSNKTFWLSTYNSITTCESSRVKAEGIIKTIPNTSPIAGPNVVAQNQTNLVYSVLPRSGSTYFWTVPADVDQILEKDNIEILGFPILGTKILTVVETAANGCQGPLRTKEILVKKEVITVKVNIEDSAMCIKGPIQLSASIAGGTPPFEIKWTGDTSYLSSTDILNPVFSANVSGAYWLKISITDVATTTSSDSILITIHELPKTLIPNKDTTLCGGEQLILNPVNTGGSGFYVYHSWTGNTNNLTRTDIQNPLFSTPVKGVYRLRYKVVDSNNCTATDSATIHIKTPEAKFTTDAIPACSPVTFSFENHSTGSVTYRWKFGDGDSTFSENISHKFVNTGNGVAFYGVELTATDESGCKHSVNKFVQIYPNPDVLVKINPDTACHPANALLEATPGNFVYDWTYGDGFHEVGKYNAYHVFENTSTHDTTYHVRMISTSFLGCLDTSYAKVVVYPSPDAQFTVTPEIQMFPDATVTINNQTNAGNFNFQWGFGDGKNSKVKDPVKKTYEKYGNYAIMLKVSSEKCSDSLERWIKINPHPPLADFDPVDPSCAPLTVNFQNKSQYADAFVWDFGDGSVSNKPNPSYTYYESGEYTVKLTVTGAGGVESKSQTIKVFVVPKAFFDIFPKVTFVNEGEVHYTNMSENAEVYEWEFGDGIVSGEQNPKHIYTSEGSYNVTLKVSTKNGCEDKFVKDNAVLVEASGRVVFPNVFSPFSKLNDNKIFLPGVIDNVSDYHLMIFNRWGELVFESSNVDIGWDGNYKGKPSKQDVYMWKVVGKYSNGMNFIKTGDVTLLY